MPSKLKQENNVYKIVILAITLIALALIFKSQMGSNIQDNLQQRAMGISADGEEVDIIKIESADFKNKVNSIIAEYIDHNPEQIVKSLNNWQQQSIAQQEQHAEKELATNEAMIEDGVNYPSSGNDNAQVIITIFFDYSCGYCQKMAPVFKKVKDKFGTKVKLIYRDLPILGPYSETMARFAMSIFSNSPENYEKVHYQLLKHNPSSEQEMWQLAKEYGLSQNQAVELMGSDQVSEKINQTKDLASKIGVYGTPAMVINGELHRGSMSYSAISQKIESLLAK